MTERNFTVVVPGWYRTRGGSLAEILQVDNPRLGDQYPVRGFVGTQHNEWTRAGYDSRGGCESHEDLITFLGTKKPREKRMVKKTLTWWANVLEAGHVATYPTKAYADADVWGRIACVELTGEYEVEEDV